MIELVSPAWLDDHADEVRIVDVRDGWEYDGIGHVPGAASIPFESFRSDDDADEGMLPGAEAFAELLGEAGIAADDPIVAYDDTHGVFAARFLVTALCYGHDELYLLDGDYSAWNREHETTGETPDIEPTTYEVREPDATPLVDMATVEAALDDPDAVIVDTRRAEEYAEGHLPGAVRLDWKELVDDESRGLKPESEIREILDDRGITADRRIVLYCNTARRISHTYAVLSHLGYETVEFYEGSFTEWTDEGGKIETSETA
ncbi:thiosulfate/3-mercaptopyruvate sulfurtransferase [Natronoarchaeum philippinense]|uniref:Sulfurtransferase n=1 Tax=Natronoarchaeum philippinense TaxID=558529 RepID=A0A285P122_NATPI|nr:sulfurtransferase [Natronoarchaeum philippinense]SNZ15158.1 thiosulfate/3-mercaptopyruvate sulfurtransferase [Natronoarchaeum philippinense]